MDYNDFIFLVWWPDFTTAKKMGDFFGDSKRHLPERGSSGAPHKMKKTYWSRNEAFLACLFSKGKGENCSWISQSALPLTQTVFCSLQVKLFSTKQNIIHITVFLLSTILIVEIIFVKVFWKQIFFVVVVFLSLCWLVVFSEDYSGIIQNVFIFHIRSVELTPSLPCEQRLHFRGMNWRAKSSLCRQLFNLPSCMREIRHAIRKQI